MKKKPRKSTIFYTGAESGQFSMYNEMQVENSIGT